MIDRPIALLGNVDRLNQMQIFVDLKRVKAFGLCAESLKLAAGYQYTAGNFDNLAGFKIAAGKHTFPRNR